MSLPLELSLKQLSLMVVASDSQSEILLLDGRARLIERVSGPVHTFGVEPGIYRVKVVTGTATQEKAVVVDKDISISFDAPRFVSSAPLAGTSTSHEYHMAAADSQSRITHVVDGTGSSLFFLVRDWTSGGSRTSQRIIGNPAEGLSLHSTVPGGERKICDLATAGTSGQGGDPWSACTISLVPGVYELRLQLPSGELLRQSFVASPGWQTQSFLFMRQYGTESLRQWRADLSRTSVLLSRNNGFSPNEPMLRVADLARVRLASRRYRKGSEGEVPLLPDEMRSLLRNKFDNPMLGIYAAHLLLLEKSLDASLFDTVVTNLRNLLGSHPDVEALALRSHAAPQTPFDNPPMLSRSWSLVVEASVERSDIVTSSLTQWSSGNFLGEGPWHVGLSPSTAAAEPDDLNLTDFESALAEEFGVMKRIRQTRQTAQFKLERPESASATEPAGVVYIDDITVEPRRRGEPEPITVEIDRDRLRSLASRFGLPANELKQRITAFESKMDRNSAVPNLSVYIK
jgi:hypothetical protein